MNNEQLQKEVEYLQGQLKEALDRNNETGPDEVLEEVADQHAETRKDVAALQKDVDEIKDMVDDILISIINNE